MLLASLRRKDGKRVLVVGLQERNMELLRNDAPIARRLDGSDGGTTIEGLEDWVLFVLGPEDTARFVAEVQAGVNIQRPEGMDGRPG